MTRGGIEALGFAIFAVLIISALIFTYVYWKQKKKVFSTKKMTIFASFFAIFVIQNLIWLPLAKLPLIPWSMDSVTIIVIGFMFGPLEAMVYGALADIVGVLISGSAPMFLYALKYPLVGLISGSFGMLYRYKKDVNHNVAFAISQVPIVALITTSFIITGTNEAAIGFTKVASHTIYATGAVSFVLIEALAIYFWRKQNREKMWMFTMILFVVVISRITTGWIMQPMADYYYWKVPFYLGSLSRIITSTYLTPITTIYSVAMTSASIYAMKATNYNG